MTATTIDGFSRVSEGVHVSMTATAIDDFSRVSEGVSEFSEKSKDLLMNLANTGFSVFWQNFGKSRYLDSLEGAIAESECADEVLPNSGVLKSFISFIKLLPGTVPSPAIGVDPDGEISLDWAKSKRFIFSISIGANNTLSYAGKFGRAKVHGFETFTGEIPDEIIRNLKRLYSSDTAQ